MFSLDYLILSFYGRFKLEFIVLCVYILDNMVNGSIRGFYDKCIKTFEHVWMWIMCIIWQMNASIHSILIFCLNIFLLIKSVQLAELVHIIFTATNLTGNIEDFTLFWVFTLRSIETWWVWGKKWYDFRIFGAHSNNFSFWNHSSVSNFVAPKIDE